ncbi:hypothetical protein QJQ45_019176 [Haematococcus lacustris]|nr:hypothetical protein QJQ45_019176 [Haematococcus lacustris]
MSSLANAIKRKTHKERSQPAARIKYGLLEKHKDYVERAKDFHRKENTIKALRRKADERNPDEFYFAMEKARTKEGVHDKSNIANKYSQEELALMRSQDVKYLSLKERVEAEKIEKLKQSLHFIGAPAQNKHTVFVDSESEAKVFDPAAYFDTPSHLLDRTFNRPKSEALRSSDTVRVSGAGSTSRGQVKQAERRKLAAYNELSQRMERREKLARTANHLAYVQEVAKKGRKRKLSKDELVQTAAAGDGNDDGASHSSTARVFKWKRERKK